MAQQMATISVPLPASAAPREAESLPDEHKEGGHVDYAAPTLPTKKPFYRTVFFNLCIVGMCAFLCPGIFNAMTLTGAGGSQSPYLVNTANAVLYAILTVMCLIGPVFNNIFGYKLCLAFGTLGYPLYAGGLYANKTKGTEWLILFGAAMTGLSGGIFWCTEGAVAMGYPQKDKIGFYLALWLAFRNSGSVIGSAINFGLNHSPTNTSSLSSSTYIVFIGKTFRDGMKDVLLTHYITVLQCIGPFLGLLLSEPKKVIRPDGSSVEMRNKISLKEEFGAIYHRVIRDWRIIVLIPLMLYLTWFQSYVGTYMALYFSTRSRALASLVASICSVVANFAMGAAVDYKRLSRKTRARLVFFTVLVLNFAMWIWQTVVQVDYLDNRPVRFDWTQPGWYRGWGVYIMANTLYNMNTNLVYWIVASLARSDRDLTRLSGFARGIESAGACGGFGMNTNKKLSLLVPLSFNFAICVVSFIVAIPSILQIGELREAEAETSESESK